MAVRISADLGLHLDLSGHVKDGRLTAQELDVRRTTFWGVFVHDKYVKHSPNHASVCTNGHQYVEPLRWETLGYQHT